MQFLRRNAIALTALVFAMTGTGIAASHWVITRASQIKPSARRELRAESAHAAEIKLAASGAHAVVSRLHLTTPFTVTASGGATQEVTGLAGASWKQRSEETQGLVEGFVRVTNAGVNACGLKIDVNVDGNAAVETERLIPPGQTVTVSVPWQHDEGLLAIDWLPESETARTHQMQVSAGLGCSPKPEPMQLEQLHIAVIGFK